MVFNYDLKKLSTELKNEFENNRPFSHIAIDNFFLPEVLSAAIEEINDASGHYKSYNDRNQIKELVEGRALVESSPINIRKIFQGLNSPEFVGFLRDLTGIDSLFADDTFRGGGIHKIGRGGKLGIHVDFSRPKWDPSVFRRANVLLYLNKDWEEEYGGDLELWDESVKNNGKCITKIAPLFNRLVIFGTKKASWHGHPTPLNTPEGKSRLSFAAYYYSNTPSDDLEEHSTIFN